MIVLTKPNKAPHQTAALRFPVCWITRTLDSLPVPVFGSGRRALSFGFYGTAMKPQWQEFEELGAAIEEAAAPRGAVVTHNDHLADFSGLAKNNFPGSCGSDCSMAALRWPWHPVARLNSGVLLLCEPLSSTHVLMGLPSGGNDSAYSNGLSKPCHTL